jgi:adenylate cyclase
MERRLAAILTADVVGYSRLMGQDEVGTLFALTSLREELIAPLVAAHRGRIVKLLGDGFLVEFRSVVDAVACALAWQQRIAERAGEPAIGFRIGINLGDVIAQDDDIYGDGVNIAARLEGLAEPGGICISQSVEAQIKGKLDLDLEDLGARELKNIAEPLKAYRIVLDGAPKAKANRTPASKPAVAVLPFDNMSGDPGQEPFVDGITEDIITALSRNRWYSVTARHSTFAYKGRSPDLREVARALGVGYLLEGSLRKAGDRVRITAQLIDAETASHVWADRFDRRLDDELAIQDEIAQRVASILGERLWQDVAKHIGQQRPETYGPYEHAYRGIELLHRIAPDDVAQAKTCLLKALELAPDLATGHLGLGFCHLMDWAFWGDPSGEALEQAFRHATELQDLAPDDAHTYRLQSRIFNARRMYDEARRCVERALAINPNDGDIIANRGVYHLFHGDFPEAIQWLDKVLVLHSDTPHTADIMHYWKALALLQGGEYEAAITTLRSISGLTFIKSQLLGACYAQVGQSEKAEEMAETLLQIRPRLRLSEIGLWQAFRRESDQKHLHDALADAGLPP